MASWNDINASLVGQQWQGTPGGTLSPGLQRGGDEKDTYQMVNTPWGPMYDRGNGLYVSGPGSTSWANGAQNIQVGPDGKIQDVWKGNSERTTTGQMAATVAGFGGAALAGGALAGAGAGGAGGGAAAAGGATASPVSMGTLGASTVGAGEGAAVGGLGAAGASGAAAGGSGLMSSAGQFAMSNPQLVTAGLGAAAGIAGSGDKTSSQSSGLPEWMQPYAKDYMQRSQALSQQPFTPYTGDRVAGFTDAQNQSLSGLQRLAGQGNAATNAGSNYTQDVLGGKYLNSNPYLDAMYNNAATRITDAYQRGTAGQTDAMFVKGGAYGGSAHADQTQQNQRALGDSLSNFASNLYGNNYAQERQNMQSSAAMSPNFSADQRANQQALMGAGAMQQGTQQAGLDANYQEFLRQQQDPYKKLGALGGAISGSPERTQTATTQGTGLLNGALGGAMTGMGLYNMYNQYNQPQQGVQQPQSGNNSLFQQGQASGYW